MNNGKLPLMPTARERMAHKNGCVELYNKLIREMGDEITKEHCLEVLGYDPKELERKKLASAEQDVLLIDGKLVNAHSDVKADKEFNILCSDGVVRSFKWSFNYKGES